METFPRSNKKCGKFSRVGKRLPLRKSHSKKQKNSLNTTHTKSSSQKSLRQREKRFKQIIRVIFSTCARWDTWNILIRNSVISDFYPSPEHIGEETRRIQCSRGFMGQCFRPNKNSRHIFTNWKKPRNAPIENLDRSS